VSSVEYSIHLTARAAKSLGDIPDKSIRTQIAKRIDSLKNDPELLGKALVGDLRGFRSIRVAKKRYRILFRIDQQAPRVNVVLVGIRKDGDKKDVYELAIKLLQRGEL
jgi:mRNA interferase RelE/StbE